MGIRSFRVRIMLLTVVLSGVILVVFGISGWMLVFSKGIESIDRDILELGRRELSRIHPPEHWANLEHALEFVYGKDPGSVAIVVRFRHGEVLFRSPQWPNTLDPAQFPNPDTVDTSQPDPRMFDPQQRRMRDRRDRLRPGDRRLQDDPLPDGRSRQPPIRLTAAEFPTVKTETDRWRVGVVGNPEITMVVAVNLRELDADVARIRNAYLAILPAALLLIAAGGWIIAGRALKPVALLTRTAEKISARDLSRRVPVREADAEFARLIMVFNSMLDRLERSFQQAVRFSADAAHELKTPLAILQGELEQAMQSAPADPDVQAVYGNLMEETLRLKSITQKLLLLARADAGGLPLQKEPLDISSMVDDALEDLDAMDTGLKLERSVDPDIWLDGDMRLLQQALQNLLTNAVKYNRPDGFIRVVLKRQPEEFVLSIANSGAEIPESDHERVFERFYRAAPDRSRVTDGFGLGLALSREIVRAHGGELILAESRNNVTRFVVKLPGYTP